MQEVTGSTPVFSTSFKSPKGDFLYCAMSYYLYIIYSKKLDRYYVGHTEGLQKRIVQHNSGISEFTSSASDWAIVHSEEFASRELARSREMAIKKKKSRKYIAWLISSFG